MSMYFCALCDTLHDNDYIVCVENPWRASPRRPGDELICEDALMENWPQYENTVFGVTHPGSMGPMPHERRWD